MFKQVRTFVLNVIAGFVDKKGDNYMSVLPDAVPFLYELLEDEDYEVEQKCRGLIKKMEETFGQSIASYFG